MDENTMKTEPPDEELTCIGCEKPFLFTAGEQEFYQRKGFIEKPKRCGDCRAARKQAIETAARTRAGR